MDNTTKPFTDFSFHDNLQSALKKMNFETCTPIQAEAMPLILSGKDVAGLAQTGTGKTAAFLLPMIERILRSTEAAPISDEPAINESEKNGAGEEGKSESDVQVKAAPGEEPQEKEASEEATDPLAERVFENWQKNHFALVLVPTRELAEQVKECAFGFIKDTDQRCVVVYGGVSIERQISELEKGVTILVATPGRLIDLFKNHKVDLKQCRAVIFDEADRMFDMGFKDDMKYILRRIPETRQLLLFSATLNLDVFNVAYQFGSNPVELNVSIDQATAENVEDFMFHLGSNEKPAHLLALFKKLEPKQVIIFTNYKNNVDRVAEFLNRNGHKAAGISSLMNQSQRKRVMDQFRTGEDTNILVATDVAARGLDIKGVDLVINYELPDDAENYVHRIGRTGRAGATGKAYSFVSDKDVEALERITRYLDRKIDTEWLETEEIPTEFEAFPRGDMYANKKRSRPGAPRRGGGGRAEGRRKPQDDRPRKMYTRNPNKDRDRNKTDEKEERRPRKRADHRKTEGRNNENREGQSPNKRVHRDKARGRHRSDSDSVAGKKRRTHNRTQDASSSQGKKKKSSSPSSRRRSRSKTPVAPAPKPGLMGKVSSAFKKLFGS